LDLELSQSSLEAISLLEKLEKQIVSFYQPHPKQAEFHAAGKLFPERLLMANNRGGKSHSGGAETSYHLTGRYPEWWQGRTFTYPVRWWACGVTNEKTRDVVQRKLFGDIGHFGTGFIPATDIKNTVMSRGITGAIDYAEIRHQSGGISYLNFKSYEAGWAKFTSDDVDGAWLDEEPELKIYTEVLARLIDRNGMVFTTFTPLQGMTEIVQWFFPAPNDARRHLTHMQIEDALHIPAERREEIIRQFPPHERDARARGIPILGSGRVFPIPESEIVVEPFKIPPHFAQLGGVDFGWDHPFGAAHGVWDRDTDVFYVANCYKDRQSTPPIHAAALKPWGSWLPFAWPHDGAVHDKGSGQALASQYRAQGLRMLGEHSTFQQGGFSTEAAVLEALTRMETGRFKVFRHLEPWLSEYRMYHRKDGQIVKKNDDILSATWKILMMLRHARTPERRTQPYTTDIDWDPTALGHQPTGRAA
jgi:phage terminase large subunit-like protein